MPNVEEELQCFCVLGVGRSGSTAQNKEINVNSWAVQTTTPLHPVGFPQERGVQSPPPRCPNVTIGRAASHNSSTLYTKMSVSQIDVLEV
ncbi:hypothetical protein EYF80_023660 [Liparis tanakae]|uniref:Uncharacterized protein n=1 Tax=Liparis tanakae TaxID=230148 RepID=A0A4Z2HN24_9TELE|nr:hypothetical protein EYF80_023660 [Liparis tanakae]